MPFEINKTELVWPGKYDADGNLVQPPRVSLPFQVIERVNETRATREARKAEGMTLFDVWDGAAEGSTFEDGWRNKLIWGENSLVLGSLLENFSGQVDLIYIDPPFATGLDFGFSVQVGDEVEVVKQQSLIEETAYRDTWGRGDFSWLSMLHHRLTLARDLLSPTGSIFLHLDWRYSGHGRLLMSEVFGAENFRNEIVWGYFGPGSPGMRQFNRKHDVIFWYSRSSVQWTFDGDSVRIPHHESTEGKFKGGGSGFIGGQAPDFTKGKIPEDWWGDIPIVSRMRSEITGYPTQKPRKLLDRIVRAASRPNDLVLDFFSGSGTASIVAELTGRRWIACDLGRFAVHTLRKRLLSTTGCKPFEVLNLGTYERQYWSTSHFGEDLDGDGKVNLLEYLKFMLKLYGAEPLSGSTHLHGRIGDAFVYVGSVSNPVTLSEVEDAVIECKKLRGTTVHVLGWEWEMGLHDPVVGLAKQQGVKLVLKQIPREVMETEAVKKGQIKFFGLAYVKFEVNPTKTQEEFVCVLSDFSTPNSDLIPEEVRDKITDWSDYVDYWAVDWDFQNDTFNHGYVTYRTRQDRSLQLTSDPHVYSKPGKYKVMVKVIDIFGNDTSKIVDVTVKG